MSENQGRRIRRSSVRGFHSGSDHCNRFCFPVRRDLLNGSSRFESNKKSVRIFRNFFNHNLWMCSSNANFSFSILIGWLGPCVGGQFFFILLFRRQRNDGVSFWKWAEMHTTDFGRLSSRNRIISRCFLPLSPRTCRALLQPEIGGNVPHRPSRWGNDAWKSTRKPWPGEYLNFQWVPASSWGSRGFSIRIYPSGTPVGNISVDLWLKRGFQFYFFLKYPIEGESEGYTVRSKEEILAISDYPLMQTEFLYDSKKGTASD